DLYVMNPLDPKSNRLLVPSKGRMLEVFDWAPDDKKAVFVENISNESQGVIWMVDVATGEKNLLTPKAGSKVGSYYDSPQFGKDGKGVYVSTDHDSEFRRLAFLDLATKQYKYLTDHIKWNVSEFKLAPDGKTVAFVNNEDGISRLHLLDTKTEQEKRVQGLPIGIISNLHWHNNSVDLAFSFESARTPTDIYALNARTEKIEPWAKGVTNGLDAEKFAEPQLIRWPSFDGREISGFLYRPPTTFKGKRPVIIDIHGGPDSQFQPRFLFDGNYFINELGVARIYPNVRGSAGYGRTFLRLDDGTRRMDAVKDIGALLDWIKKQPDLDAERVMVQGGSYGGYMALSVAMTYGDRIRAALSDSGMSNLATYVERTERWRRDTRRVEYGDERDPKTREFLDRAAPLNNAAKITKPVMIVQGERDPRVKASESKQVVQSLRKHNPNVWFLLGMNEGHFFAQPVNREFQLLTTILFVKEHLLKPEQVSRYSPQPSAP
nr:S9 family peptidase [Pyrinomonadaceae bacterium]